MNDKSLDLVIRNAAIVDGTGDPMIFGDIGVRGGEIVAVGEVLSEGTAEIDATGLIVTPGFVDVHTHYDGQITWENRVTPSSEHGVTTVVTGNCGVGFAPVRPAQRASLVKVMEGVEDIPEIVMTDGIPWNWESFPEYLDALAERQFDIDVATQIAHSPVRVYVMGDRGADHAAATDSERQEMTRIVSQAIRAGALGVSTSRSLGHRLKDGTLAPSVTSADPELHALADGLREAGGGVFQLITEAGADPDEEMRVVRALAEVAERPVSFTLLQTPRAPDNWRTMLSHVDAMNRDGLTVRGQVFPRPVGVLMGLDLTLHPFVTRRSYKAIAHLPLDERAARMRDPEVKRRILAEEAEPDPQPMNNMLIAQAEKMFLLEDPVDYAPTPDRQIGALATAAGEDLESFVYDRLLDHDGRAILYLPGANFVGCSLDATREMMVHPHTIYGLGDGGAHYGFICDASFPTFALTYWVRDVAEDRRIPIEEVVAELTSKPAAAVGLSDRGRIAVGMKADLNLIDADRLRLHAPHVVHDLPAGGRRLRQHADGYVATIVSGEVTYRDGEPTGALPGRLVRGTVNSAVSMAA